MAVVDRRIEAQKELSRALRKYAGQWVAVRGNEVVAHAKTAEAVRERTADQKIDRVFRVPTSKGSALLY